MLPAAQAPAGDFGFPFRLKAADGGSKPEPYRELLRFVSTVPHSLSTGESCAQDVFSEGASARLSAETFVAKAQLHFPGVSLAQQHDEDNPLPTGKPDFTRGTL